MNFISKLLMLRKVDATNGIFLFSNDTEVKISKGAKILIRNGILRTGYSSSKVSPFSHYSKTKIHLEENAILEINGDVNIGAGTSIVLKKDSRMIFGGSNVIAHNNLFYCHKQIEFGFNSCTSWNCQFMDSDGHELYSAKNGGRFIQPFYSPLIVGEHVGFQMNVTVPRGVRVGKNALISCNVVLKSDVPEESIVILEQELKIKKGIMTPYGKET